MKKTLLIISAASLLLAGCSKEQLVDERSYTGPVTVVNATFESLTEDGTTKAAVTDAGVFTWQNGDKAAFAESSASTSYCFGTNSADGTTASFAIDGEHTFTASSWAIYPDDLTTDQVPTNLKVKVPASRVWVNEQTNVAMYGKYETASSSFSFSHMGGLVRVRVKNVPTNAREFVFKASGCKINGEFSVNTVSESKVIETVASDNEDEQTYTLTWTTAPAAENTMDFYIPLPKGTYSGGFAFYLKDVGHNVLYSKVGSTPQTIARKKLLLMPAITLVGGSIESIEKAAVVANIPAGYSGDFLLPQSEKVLLKINASTEDHNITLKYDGGTLPTNLEVKVVDGDNAGNYNAKLLGNLPSTHVEFTQGHIDHTELTTSSSTLAVINPATIGTLTVTGGNVLLKGATVTSIVVDENAVASEETQAPVQIVVEKSSSEETFTAPAVTANANVIVAPASGVSVNVTAKGDAKVANAGEGSVTGVTTTDAKAKIGENKYFTLADAVKAAPTNATEATTITLLDNVTDGAGIFLAAADKKNIVIDLNDKTYTASTPVGSAGTVNQAFHLEKGNTIKIQNGTLNVDVNKKTDFRFIIQNYADLTLEGVTLDGSNLAKTDKVCYTVSNNSGAVEFKNFREDIKTNITAPDGGVAFDVCKYASYEVPTVTWNSTGTVTGGIELSGGKFVVAKDLAVDRPIVAIDDKDVQSVSSTLTINSGATISTASTFKDCTPGISGPGVTSLVQVRRGADLTIDGAGSIEAGAQTYSAVMVTVNNDNDEKTAILTVNDQVTITGDYYGIVGNGNRHNTKITVNGGTIKGTHDNDNHGIYHPQNGSLIIKGESTQIIGYNNGIEMRAGKLVVNNGTIIGTATNTTVVPNGNGSTTKGAGIAIAKHTTNLPISVTINKGTIIGAQAISNANPQNVDAEVTVVINGGTFSDLSGLNYVAESGTYKLANDVNLGENILEINSGKAFSIDLNGKTLTGRTNIKHGNVTFKNGNIAGGNKQALNVYGSSTEATNYSVVTVDSDVTVTADVYAVCVFGATAGGTGYGAVANIAGTINTNGDTKNGAIFVSGNLGAGKDSEFAVSEKNAVNIQSTAKITSSTDAAVALNGSAKVTVAKGAELTGATAIAAKRGELVVNGGTITGTMDPGKSNPDTYMNGTEMTGSAVSATASYKADGPLSVEIKDGTFTSKAYTILNNHDGCEFKISGGTFDTDMEDKGIAVYARLGSVNITGGTFTNDSNSEATLHVGCPDAKNKTIDNGPKLTISGTSTGTSNKTVVKNKAEGPYTHKKEWCPLTVNMANELTYKAVTITGGEFHGQKPERDDFVTGDNGKFVDTSNYDITGNSNVWTVSARSQQN